MAESGAKKRVKKAECELSDVAEGKVAEIKEYVSGKAAHITSEAKKYGAQGSKKVADSVKKQPFKALGIAALVGAVFGLFFRRKK